MFSMFSSRGAMPIASPEFGAEEVTALVMEGWKEGNSTLKDGNSTLKEGNTNSTVSSSVTYTENNGSTYHPRTRSITNTIANPSEEFCDQEYCDPVKGSRHGKEENLSLFQKEVDKYEELDDNEDNSGSDNLASLFQLTFIITDVVNPKEVSTTEELITGEGEVSISNENGKPKGEVSISNENGKGEVSNSISKENACNNRKIRQNRSSRQKSENRNRNADGNDDSDSVSSRSHSSRRREGEESEMVHTGSDESEISQKSGGMSSEAVQDVEFYKKEVKIFQKGEEDNVKVFEKGGEDNVKVFEKGVEDDVSIENEETVDNGIRVEILKGAEESRLFNNGMQLPFDNGMQSPFDNGTQFVQILKTDTSGHNFNTNSGHNFNTSFLPQKKAEMGETGNTAVDGKVAEDVIRDFMMLPNRTQLKFKDGQTLINEKQILIKEEQIFMHQNQNFLKPKKVRRKFPKNMPQKESLNVSGSAKSNGLTSNTNRSKAFVGHKRNHLGRLAKGLEGAGLQHSVSDLMGDDSDLVVEKLESEVKRRKFG
jgi:hypothetical protein